MDPAFAPARRRLADLRREWDRLRDARALLARLRAREDDEAAGAWVANAALSSGVSGLYTGMEEIVRGVLSAVDGYVPAGDRSHQDVLDQASVAIDGVRPPVISDRVYDALTRLKAFRHFERHNYRFRFDSEQVERNEKLVEDLVPDFVTDVERFIAAMSDPANPPRSGEAG